jgi:hypothetical protein
MSGSVFDYPDEAQYHDELWHELRVPVPTPTPAPGPVQVPVGIPPVPVGIPPYIKIGLSLNTHDYDSKIRDRINELCDDETQSEWNYVKVCDFIKESYSTETYGK